MQLSSVLAYVRYVIFNPRMYYSEIYRYTDNLDLRFKTDCGADRISLMSMLYAILKTVLPFRVIFGDWPALACHYTLCLGAPSAYATPLHATASNHGRPFAVYIFTRAFHSCRSVLCFYYVDTCALLKSAST